VILLSRLLLAVAGVSIAWLVALSTPASGALGPDMSALTGAERVLHDARSAARPVPAPIAGEGYRLVFQDSFNRFRRRVWTRSIWYDSPAAAGDIFVRRGVLHLVSRRSRNYPNISVTTLKSRSFRRGYFEARMRWTRGHGAWPGFWLVSSRHATNPAWPSINPYCANHGLPAALCWSSELDVFEGQGSEPRVFYGTVHKNSSGDYGVADDQNSNNYHPQRKNLTRYFHVYGARWTASRITWYLDGKRLFSAPVFASTDQPMFIILDMWTGGWTTDPDSTTPDTLRLKVDWVRVWHR
jgi:beta-glucanase (GH16 family)